MENIGKYELREILGRGGMGVVYRAYDPVIAREVAVKIIQQKAVESPELKARFVREARMAGRFSHENITVIHDMGESDGKMFIVMEYLQGRDLRSIIDKREPLLLLDKLNYARQICKGLRYAHANGIVHRDIKPENVKVLTDGRIKIMDFGIAKPSMAEGIPVAEATDPILTQMGMRIGTPWYMSPEQVKGAAIDKRSDIFSFGVLFYELLTYQKPFSGDDTTVLYKILHEEPEPIRLEEAELETSLRKILAKCLAKSPDDRYADCLLILRDIESAPGGAGLPRIVPELLREAEELHRQQRLQEAEQKFTEVLDVEPENAVARASIERLTVIKGEATIPAPGSAEHKTGEVISHFQIIQRISGGGMGVVYKAEDLTLRRTVALKFLAADWTRNPVAKKRFLKEAQAASALDHPNVCTIYEVGETADGLLYLCMAFYEGEDLSARIRQGPLSIEQVFSIIEGVARGLGKAHEAGILHRDIKPANILITKSGEIKIVDFGIAKLSTGTQITRAGSVVGTLPYMSPEQIKGLELDQRADLWSLAVVLYQSLAGKVPFDDSSEAALFYSIVNLEPDPISILRKDLPEGIDQFFAKALAKKPESRHANAAEFLAALHSLRTGTPVSPSPAGQRPEEVAPFRQKVNALVREAEQRLAEGKLREARKSVQAALALDPDHLAAARLLEKTVAAIAAGEAAAVESPAGGGALSGRADQRPSRGLSRTFLVAGSLGIVVVLAVVMWLLFSPAKPVPSPVGITSAADSSSILTAARDQIPIVTKVGADLQAARDSGASAEEMRGARSAANAGLEELRTFVSESRRAMLAARRDAEQAGAKQRARTLFDEAARMEMEADRSARSDSREDQLAARNSYATSRQGYSRAAAEARAVLLAKNDAETGRNDMRKAKQRVPGSETEKLASTTYRKALDAEEAGVQRYQQGDYTKAREAFAQAERFFTDAGTDIAAARNQQRTVTEPRKDPPPVSVAKEPEKKDPAAKEREEKEATQQEVKRLLDEYRRHIEQGNLSALTSLLGMNAEDQKKWTVFFNNTEERKVTTDLVSIDVTGGSALARFRWKISFQSGNTPQTQDIMKSWELQSESGNWKIVREK